MITYPKAMHTQYILFHSSKQKKILKVHLVQLHYYKDEESKDQRREADLSKITPLPVLPKTYSY